MKLDEFVLILICAIIFFGLLFVLAEASYKEKQLQDFCKEQFGYSSKPSYNNTFWLPDSCEDINGTKRPVEYYKKNWII